MHNLLIEARKIFKAPFFSEDTSVSFKICSVAVRSLALLLAVQMSCGWMS